MEPLTSDRDGEQSRESPARHSELPGFARLREWKQASAGLNYGRDVVAGWATRIPDLGRPVDVLDVGCGVGSDLQEVARMLAPRPARLSGTDLYEPSIAKARTAGIDVYSIDIERDAFPFEGAVFDYVIANQILEHVKEVFWTLAEAERVLRPGGLLCVGVPNLASLHNRVLLALGQQPSSVEPLGPHVRGFTLPALKRLLTWSGHFELVATAGANFYPLPPAAARSVTRLWPSGAVSIFALARKTGAPGTFLETLQADTAETNFYRGSAGLSGRSTAAKA